MATKKQRILKEAKESIKSASAILTTEETPTLQELRAAASQAAQATAALNVLIGMSLAEEGAQ